MYSIEELNKKLQEHNPRLCVKKTRKGWAQIFLRNAEYTNFAYDFRPVIKTKDNKTFVWTAYTLDKPILSLPDWGCYEVYRPEQKGTGFKHRNYYQIINKLKEMHYI